MNETSEGTAAQEGPQWDSAPRERSTWVTIWEPSASGSTCRTNTSASTRLWICTRSSGEGDPADLPSQTLDMAISVLAVGVDPERCTLFVQSDVPEHIELAWLFNTVAPVGDLERMTQYKDKSQRYDSIPVGLLNYPVLQAADILVYRADAVPVGEDQRQHLELTRDIAPEMERPIRGVLPRARRHHSRGRPDQGARWGG